MTISPTKLAKAIKYTNFSKKPVTVENVNFYLGAGDKITQADLDQYHAAAAAGTVAEPESLNEFAMPVGRVEVATEAEPIISIVEEQHVKEVPALTVVEAQRRIIESQVALRVATDAQRDARGRVGAAVQCWTEAIGERISPEQNVRQHIATSNEMRRLRAEGKLPRRLGRVHRSVIDATAAAYNQGSGSPGGGNAFRRVVKDANGQWVRPASVHDRGRR